MRVPRGSLGTSKETLSTIKVFDLYRAEGRILCFDKLSIALFHQKSNARTYRLTHRYSSYFLVPASKSIPINLFSVKEAPFIQVSEEKK